MKNLLSLASAFLLALGLTAPSAALAKSRYLQCVPYARQISGIQIRGNAKTWWGQAAGRYERGQSPRVGAVMALPGFGKMRLGHVATVSSIVSDREIRLSHANWSRRGGIERNVRAIDVSDKGDWSRVRIWYASNGDLGTTSYPVSGFIYPNASAGEVQLASATPVKVVAVKGPSAAKVRQTPLISDDVFALAEKEQLSFAAR
jgi:surface antigen